MKKSTVLLPMLFMLMAGSFYGLVSPIIRLTYFYHFSAADVTDAQYGFGVIVLWTIVILRKRKSHISRNQWILLLALGVVSALVSYSYYMALTTLSASFATILLFQFAWMATFIDIVVTRKLPTIMKWVGLVVILSGTFLAVGTSGTGSGSRPVWAIAFGLFAAFFYALTLYLSGYADEKIAPDLRSAIVVTAGMLFIFIPFRPNYLFSGVLWHGLFIWGVILAGVGQIAPMLLMLSAIPKIGGRMAAILGTIELPVSVFGAWWLNHDRIFTLQWIGVLFILFGIAVSESDTLLRNWWIERNKSGKGKHQTTSMTNL